MSRIWVAGALSLFLTAACAGSVAPEQAQTLADPVLAGPEMGIDIDYTEAGTRLTVPVAVAGSGPYHFIIDTGAERTVISRELASRLGLAAGRPVNLTSMVDRSLVQTVVVPALSIHAMGDPYTVHAPSLDGRDLGAVGMLGIDTLRNYKVTIDFDKGVMTVNKSGALRMTRREEDEIVVSGSPRLDQLIVAEAYIDGTRIQVVLDTGTQMSIGNLALLRLISDNERKTLRPTVITSVTGAKAPASFAVVDRISMDGILFGNLPVAFADVEPFRHFELQNRPALLLGMDALRSFRRVEIDFPNRQIRFRVPPDPRPLRSNTSSIVPGVRGFSAQRSY